MPAFLCISLTFHDGRFHGRRDGGESEWPPSPLRVFQAVVAACAARSCLDQSTSALRWFEQKSKPIIIAPAVFHPQPYRIAVPNNDLDVSARYWAKGQDAPKYKNPQDLKSMKTVRPVHLEGGDTVHYLYDLHEPIPADITAHLKLLGLAARSITHLGWGIDMVAARANVIGDEQAAKLAGVRWRPLVQSATYLRAPRAGVLNALIERHDAFLHRVSDHGYTPVPPLTGFSVIAYDDTDRINRRPCAAFDLLPVGADDRRSRKPFRQEDIVHVAAMLRHSTWEAAKRDLDELAGRDEQWAEQFVAGHGPHRDAESFPRFSYIPLPSVGHSHADGMVRRVLIAETPGEDGRSAAWAQRRLAGLPLRDEDTGLDVAALRGAQTDGDYVFKSYCGSSDRWQTVTPIILPGFDDNDDAKRLKLLLRCFDQGGIPREIIADLDVQKSPWLRASAQTRDYKRSDRIRHLPACHVRVYFKRQIAGPIALGAGRHRGLGLMAACD
ncbi:MAG: type I-U CRISPR-associated protein Csb2 [Tepidisphaeraceae bacterium]